MSGILQLVNTFGPSGPFAVKNSLRLRSPANAYLSRVITLSATWTLSIWVKRGALGVTSPIFGASVLFNSNDTLTAGTLTTTAVYRDPSAWYHIVVSNSGCYVNGVSVGSTTTGVLVSPLIGSNAVNYFDGYLAELNLIDGQALTPSSFGAFDATSGVWQPTRYSGTYGTNGFYLKFSDTTSTTTLCYDYSGNSNNWTPNNISLTAGSTYDSMLDSPTNYDNGGNGVGNYAVLNPLSNFGTTITNGNLTVDTGTTNGYYALGSIAIPSSGTWYWEYTPTANGSQSLCGISSGAGSGSLSYYGVTGEKYISGTGSAYGATYTTNDVIGVAVDAGLGTVAFYKNNVSQGSITYSAAGLFPYFSDGTGGSGTIFQVNFGQRPFAYTPPTGYKALNTQNLPAPSIQNGANYMAATLYTGNGATQSIVNTVNGVSFQPDFVWGKLRTTSSYHRLSDSVRGASLTLATNVTDAEVSGNGLVSFDAAGFSMNSSTNINQVYPYVAWQWKAGGTAVSNTAGSITSSVSANTTSGFAVVTYTGNLSSAGTATVGHGLGTPPSMIITKSRSATSDWIVHHVSLTSPSHIVFLDLTAAQFDTSATGGTVAAPTSTVFTTNYITGYNINGVTQVAYCFAAIPGYSAFGSYVGNGSADGTFVYCGFRPRYVLVKATNSAENWFTWDTSRDPYNVASNDLYPNLSNAESAAPPRLDFLSNGFKCRASAANPNLNGVTYIYAAFAENPLKYSLAR